MVLSIRKGHKSNYQTGLGPVEDEDKSRNNSGDIQNTGPNTGKELGEWKYQYKLRGNMFLGFPDLSVGTE